ncbi:MAG: pamO 4, partial [Mycobacterium sp.]|nr:pamO 4 [Mycobacterium sp.]
MTVSEAEAADTSRRSARPEQHGVPAAGGCGPTATPEDVDIPALREKYRLEREKRLRKEGSKQYVELEDDFAGYYETDPHTPRIERDAIDADIDVAVLGGGFGGLLSAAHLKKAGVEDVRIIELGGDFGGVWYWNRYPGIQCDNESYCYIPLLEELDFMPSKKFADGPEIYEHCRNIGKHFGLYDNAILSTQVRNLKWDDEIERWRITTDRDDDIRARFVVMASG